MRFYPTAQYRELSAAYARMLIRPGVGVLSGPAGVGKTRAMRRLRDLHSKSAATIRFDGEDLDVRDVWRTLARLHTGQDEMSRSKCWRIVESAFAKGPGTPLILVVDEAQHLSRGVLVDLGDFVRTFGHGLLALWLIGLPGSLSRIDEVFAGRVDEHVEFAPLDLDTLAAMILAERPDVRAVDAERIWRESGGVLRRTVKILEEETP